MQMMTALSSCVRRGRHTLRRLSLDPRVHRAGGLGVWALGGFLLSAASMVQAAQPFALGLLLSAPGVNALGVALGAMGGYALFWGAYGLQGMVWIAAGLPCALVLGRLEEVPGLLRFALGGLLVAVTGLSFRLLGLENPRISLYLLRIAGAGLTAVLFDAVKHRREPFADWIAAGVGVLALAQIAPAPWLSLGVVAAGALGTAGTFPAAVLAGFALDLGGLTPIPMTGVLCMIYLLRLVPGLSDRLLRLSPGFIFLLVAGLTGKWDPMPLPALVLGGLLGKFLPGQPRLSTRRGPTGTAQVRLELAASVLGATQTLLLETQDPPIDEQALLRRCAERACGSCPNRRGCRERELLAALPPERLHGVMLTSLDLGFSCRKNGRVLQELQRTQEQLRSMTAARKHRQEHRRALIQQYGFLCRYLQELSDSLGRREPAPKLRFRVRVSVYANRPREDNGDRCCWFPGTEANYYVLLCDGMGTGLGAVDAGTAAAGHLRQLLAAGFPAEHALASLNSLLALGDRAGSATVDLVKIRLDTGRCTLYKWGAAPSVLKTAAGAEKIGTAGPPPGITLEGARESATRLSLGQGQTLVLLSDGVRGEEFRSLCLREPEASPGELAQRLLEQERKADDATVAVIRLVEASMAT